MTVAPSNAAPLPPTRFPLGLLKSATVLRLVVGIWMLWAGLLLGGTLLCESVRGGTIALGTVALGKDQILLVSHLGSSAFLVAAGWIWFLGFNRLPAAGT
jgi:divalent metal cation (Fe/Co/Zn/Cd) transporter